MVHLVLLAALAVACAIAGAMIFADLFRPTSSVLGSRFNALSGTIRGFVGAVLILAALLLGVCLAMVELP